MQIVLNTVINENPAVINEDGSVVSFGSYILSLWDVPVILSCISYDGSTKLDFDVLPTNKTIGQLEADITALGNTYATKTLSQIEQIVVNYNNGGVYSDFKQARKAMQNLILDVNGDHSAVWVTLTTVEKKIATKWFVVKTEWTGLFTLEELLAHGQWFDLLSTESRASRYQAARLKVFSFLNYSDAALVTSELNSIVSITIPNEGTFDVINLETQYIRNGKESLALGDGCGLFDYVDYNLRNKNVTPLFGATMPYLANIVLDILVNGNY